MSRHNNKKKMVLGAMAMAVAVPVVMVPMADNAKAFEASSIVAGKQDIGDYNVTVSTDKQSLTINKYNGEVIDSKVVIPAEIGGIKVTYISSLAYKGLGLKEITLSEGITRLLYNSFENNEIKKVNIPSSVVFVDPRAFKGNPIEEVTIEAGSSLESGGNTVKLTHLKSEEETLKDYRYSISSEGISGISQYEGNSLDVKIPNEIYGKPVEIIEFGAFSEKMITNITLPDSLKIVESEAFSGNRFEELKLPKNLKIIGVGAFSYNMNLKSLEVPASVEEIGKWAFQRTGIVDLEINEGVKKIGEAAFFGHSIMNLVLPKSLDLVSKEAFRVAPLTKNPLKNVIVFNKYLKYDAEVFGHSSDPTFTMYAEDDSTSRGYADKYTNVSFRPLADVPTELLPQPKPVEPVEPVEPPVIGGGTELWDAEKGGEFITKMVPEITVVGGKSFENITLQNFDFGKVETVTTELGKVTFTPDGKGNTIVSSAAGIGTDATSKKQKVEYNGTHILTLNVKAKPVLNFKVDFKK